MAMAPSLTTCQSPVVSDPGSLKERPMEDKSDADDRFLYKHQRRDQRKKVFFPKSGGPSILVFVKDNPKVKRNQNKPNPMYNQYGVLPHLPFIPTSALPYDPLRLPTFPNQSLLMSMLPPLPTMPQHPLQTNSVPQFRQRHNSNPNLGYAPFVPPQTCVPEPTPHFQEATFVSSNNVNNPATVPSNYSYTGRMSSGAGQVPEKPAAPIPAYFYPYYQPQLVVPDQRPPKQNTPPNNNNPYMEHARASLAPQVPEPKQAAPRPPSRQYTQSLPETSPASYANYYPKCSCSECVQFGYQFPESNQNSPTDSISTDSGFSEPVIKSEPVEVPTTMNSSMLETRERPLVFCDQNNPTFSLDSASLSQVMGMARRENIERFEPIFMDEKRQIRKQIPCRNLNQTGMCHFGETCWFSHQTLSYNGSNGSIVN